MHIRLIAVLILGLTASAAASDIALKQRHAGLDLAAFIQVQQASWSNQAEAIGHWAGYYQINPLALLVALEVGQSNGWLGADGRISQVQIAALAKRLGQQRLNLAEAALAIPQSATLKSAERARLVETFRERFAHFTEEIAKSLPAPSSKTTVAEPAMALPIESDRDWFFNGVHTWTGDDDDTPMSSIDLLIDRNHRWGDDTSEIWVAAAHSGIATVFSRCFIRVTHPSGWFTDYYHLENVQIQSGDQVRAGQHLSNYADDLDTAICQGGHSALPHLHFALGKDDRRVDLATQRFSEHLVHPGRHSYDRNPNYMWLEKLADQRRLHAWVDPISRAAAITQIDYHFNGMWYQPSLSGHGLNLVTMPSGSGDGMMVFVVMFTYDDSGLANFYSGNVDVASWRLGETLTLPLFQSANGGFSQMSRIDFSSPADFEWAGDIELILNDCTSGNASFTLFERSTDALVQQEWTLEKIIGVPVDVCQQNSTVQP